MSSAEPAPNPDAAEKPARRRLRLPSLWAGLGAKDDFIERHFTDAVRGSIKAFNGAAKTVTVAALDWHVRKRDAEWQAYSLAVAARETAFRTDELKSKRESDTNGAGTVGLLVKGSNAGAEQGLRYGGAIANGMPATAATCPAGCFQRR